ncbi:hypothetical protein RND71_025196 [Anisodus tanguticus]|uniref:Uncharacterized protein n=1 Tax=Anisodus tanguticus TaxID=243964 RepID=A0AAE1RPR1_9SOLA|nr:hypothetical protein RND71_025196 [Anisodus tanguticus]
MLHNYTFYTDSSIFYPIKLLTYVNLHRWCHHGEKRQTNRKRRRCRPKKDPPNIGVQNKGKTKIVGEVVNKGTAATPTQDRAVVEQEITLNSLISIQQSSTTGIWHRRVQALLSD